ncbi:nitrogen regulation protein NR(II), partial [Candidatus Auribacterota bacterium]
RIDKKELLTYIQDISRENGFLHSILKSLNDAVIVLDNEKTVLYINPAGCEMLGARVWKDIVGKKIDDLRIDKCVYDFLRKEKTGNRQSVNRELKICYPRMLDLAVSILPLQDESGEVVGMAVIFRDITEKRKMEDRMIRSEKLGAFSVIAAGLAHEIGNPLNSLNIHVQLIQRELSKLKTAGRKKLSDLFSVVSTEIDRLDDIVRGFLQAIRPVKPNYRENNINDVVKSTLKLLQPEMKSLDISLEKELSDEIPRTMSDKTQLKQAFVNILKNSVQAMPDGGIIAVVTWLEGDLIKIAVRDDGKGISPENLSRIFDPHFTTRKEGMGIGLMMTQKIIKAHGGEIEVKSQAGIGTSVTVILPVRTIVPKMLPEK